jgi:hypothetical protein
MKGFIFLLGARAVAAFSNPLRWTENSSISRKSAACPDIAVYAFHQAGRGAEPRACSERLIWKPSDKEAMQLSNP